MMSSTASMPTDRRMLEADTPARALDSGVPCEWVVVAGWLTSDRTSPMLTRQECSLSASMNDQARFLRSSSDAPSGAVRCDDRAGALEVFFWMAFQSEDARPA